jgi:4-amino-4-deoxy-L-arabinose transferase-like glycosyltransferase
MNTIFQNKSFKISVLLGFVTVICFAFFFQLGRDALIDYDEADYAKVTVNAIESGDYLTATLDDNLWFEKPPLQFWVSGIFLHTGMSDEWAMRLPAALAGIITVLLVGLIIYEISGSLYGAILGGIALTTVGIFLMTSREFKLDVPVTMFIILALFAYIKSQKNVKWLLLIGISVGLAVMVKSAIGLLIFFIVGIFALAFWNFNWLKEKWFWLGNILGVIIILPWHLYEWFRFGNDFIFSYFFYHILSRYQSNILNNNFTIWTYVDNFINFALPWTILFALSAIYLFVFWQKIDKKIRSTMLGSVVAAIALFVLFSISKTKIIYYLIPIYPFMALAVALCSIDVFKRLKIGWQKNFFLVGIIFFSVWGASQIIEVGYHQHKDLNIESRFADEARGMGLFLSSKPVDSVYFDSNLYKGTIRYYADKSVKTIDRNNLPARPFYLILFWSKAHNDPFYKNLLKDIKPVYEGNFRAVYFVK